MKILQINNNHFNLGGAEVVYLNTIQLLSENKHTVLSLSRENKNNIRTAAKEYFIPFKNNFISKFYSQQTSRLIDKIIKSEKPDIAHIHNIIGGITFSVLSQLKKNNVPVVATIHDFRLMCPSYVFMNGKKEICERCKGGHYFNCIKYKCVPGGFPKSLVVSVESYIRDFVFPFENLIDKFIFVSSFSMNKFLEVNPSLSNKAEHIYNFSNKESSTLKLKGNYFLFFGRLSHEKGIPTLLQAFDKVSNLKLKIVGDGPLKSIVEQNKNENIEYLGYKSGSELNDLILNSSFIIVPSECYENNPLSIVEAYANSKPVIGSRLGGIKEIVLDEKLGYTFEHGNTDDLINILNKASNITDEKYNELSENSRKFYEDNFSQHNHYKKLLNVYNKTLTNYVN